MLTPTPYYINRRPEVLNRFGIGNTCLHNRIKQGLMPPPIPLGARAVGWLQHELDAVLAAMVAGKSEDHIRALISHLVDSAKKRRLGEVHEEQNTYNKAQYIFTSVRSSIKIFGGGHYHSNSSAPKATSRINAIPRYRNATSHRQQHKANGLVTMAKSHGKNKGRTDAPGGFAGIPRVVLKHCDYQNLSGGAVKLLIELASQFKGHNNGDLTTAYSVLKKRGFKSKDTISRAIKELMRANLVIQTREGRFTNPGGVCALYALTWLAIDECPGKNLTVSPTAGARIDQPKNSR